ncbi:MAG: polyhydroxyalkanoic acid system family protein [Salinibacter sp.]
MLASTSAFQMADIDLTRSHSLGLADGRDAVERVAEQLENDLGVQYEWANNTLHFDGQGADGSIEVGHETVHILINLSAFLRPLRSRVKAEAEGYLDRHFAS